eukprot:m.107367 g.107367  ORF g.107367 m.107367 type:complete len:97 (-) comp15314_c0_seq3:1367-1657(-)
MKASNVLLVCTCTSNKKSDSRDIPCSPCNPKGRLASIAANVKVRFFHAKQLQHDHIIDKCSFMRRRIPPIRDTIWVGSSFQQKVCQGQMTAFDSQV